MTRNLAVEFRIAANTLRQLANHSDPRKAQRARQILEDPALFRAYAEQRSRTVRSRRSEAEAA
ncbi:hypothetical protein [Arenibaculum pallidiluteum]|uniref:hypothetical protein n=1 Tax=Arenibaculum pallidiluteum TaxID=2812559 RepID=UPI001A971B31|nr:hypothetical protein [Arenibaculum pallidiluteum]